MMPLSQYSESYKAEVWLFSRAQRDQKVFQKGGILDQIADPVVIDFNDCSCAHALPSGFLLVLALKPPLIFHAAQRRSWMLAAHYFIAAANGAAFPASGSFADLA